MTIMQHLRGIFHLRRVMAMLLEWTIFLSLILSGAEPWCYLGCAACFGYASFSYSWMTGLELCWVWTHRNDPDHTNDFGDDHLDMTGEG